MTERMSKRWIMGRRGGYSKRANQPIIVMVSLCERKTNAVRCKVGRNEVWTTFKGERGPFWGGRKVQKNCRNGM